MTWKHNILWKCYPGPGEGDHRKHIIVSIIIIIYINVRERGIPQKCHLFEKHFIKNSYSVAVSRALVSNIEFYSKFRSYPTSRELRSSSGSRFSSRFSRRCSFLFWWYYENDRIFGQVRDRLTPIPCVPTGSGDFPSNSNRKKIMKAAGMVFQIYEEPRKSQTTVLEQQNAKKKSWGLRLEMWKYDTWHLEKCSWSGRAGV